MSASRPSLESLRPSRRAAVVLGLAVVLGATGAGCAPPADEAPDPGLSVARTLGGGDDEGFARAVEPREFSFPADHGPHPAFRTEWWYLTGNLTAAGGRHFGYQATFFRTALKPPQLVDERPSGWAANQIYMAHFALTDSEGGIFHSFERFGRGAQGLAGARAEPLRVWLEDWELAADPAAPAAGAASVLPPLALRLATAEAALDLRLTARKPIVLHGERGLSRKGAGAGNASYYYSFTRLETSGSVRVGDLEVAVEGASWLDREWSTSVLEQGLVGWDWLSLQLDDGSELMYYRLRREDGTAGYESGTLVAPDGTARQLATGASELSPTRRWTSPATGVVYPVAWRLTLPAEDLELAIEPTLAAQELTLSFTYWEGAVKASGSRRGRPLSGAGYVELTGYDEAAAPRGGAQG